MKKYYMFKRTIHLIVVVAFIPISIIAVLSTEIGNFLEEFEEQVFDDIRDWVGYEDKREDI